MNPNSNVLNVKMVHLIVLMNITQMIVLTVSQLEIHPLLSVNNATKKVLTVWELKNVILMPPKPLNVSWDSTSNLCIPKLNLMKRENADISVVMKIVRSAAVPTLISV